MELLPAVILRRSAVDTKIVTRIEQTLVSPIEIKTLADHLRDNQMKHFMKMQLRYYAHMPRRRQQEQPSLVPEENKLLRNPPRFLSFDAENGYKGNPPSAAVLQSVAVSVMEGKEYWYHRQQQLGDGRNLSGDESHKVVKAITVGNEEVFHGFFTLMNEYNQVVMQRPKRQVGVASLVEMTSDLKGLANKYLTMGFLPIQEVLGRGSDWSGKGDVGVDADPPPCSCSVESLEGLEAGREIVMGLSYPYRYFDSNHWFHISEYYVSRHTHVAPNLPSNGTVYIVAPDDLFVNNLIPMTFFLLLLAFTDGTARRAEVLPRRALTHLAVAGDVLILDNSAVESYVYDSSLPPFERTQMYKAGERHRPVLSGASVVLLGEGEGEGGGGAPGGEADTRSKVPSAGQAASTSEARNKDSRDRRRLDTRRGAGGGAAWSGNLRLSDDAGGDLDVKSTIRRLAPVLGTRRSSLGEEVGLRVGGGGGHGRLGQERDGEAAQVRDGDVRLSTTTAAKNGNVVVGHGIDGVRKRQQIPLDRRGPSSTGHHDLGASLPSGDASDHRNSNGDGAETLLLPPELENDRVTATTTTTNTAAAAATSELDDARVLAARGGDEVDAPPAKVAQADTTADAAETSAAVAVAETGEFFPSPSTKDVGQKSSGSSGGGGGASGSRSCACARYIGEFGPAPVERGWWFRHEPVENARVRIDALCGHIFRRRQQGHSNGGLGEEMEAGRDPSGERNEGDWQRQQTQKQQQWQQKRLVIYQRDTDRRLLGVEDNMETLKDLLGADWELILIVHDNDHEPCWLYSQLMDADMLVTPHGFQSMLLLFLPRGATILEVFPYKYWKDGYAPLAKEWGVQNQHIMSRPVSWAKRLALFFVPMECCMRSIYCRKWSRGADVRLEAHHLLQIAKAARAASSRKEEFLSPPAPVAPGNSRRRR